MPKLLSAIVVMCSLLAFYSPLLLAQANNPGSIGYTLEDFFTAALDYSPSLRIAEENLKISGAQKDVARGQLLPQVSANANLSDNRRTANDVLNQFDGERYSLQLSQVLFNWRSFMARKRLDDVEDQVEAEYFYELSSVLTDVADKYFTVLQAQDALVSVQSELEAVANQLDQINSLFELQLAQITDLRLAQAELSAIQAQQIRLQSELSLAQEALRSVSGLDVGALFTLDNEIAVPGVENSLQYWVQLARENNQMVQARKSALRAAEKGISESKGLYMPTVSLIAQKRETNLGFDNALLSDVTDSTVLGLDITIPIYAGGSNRARISEAVSRHSIAENELRQIELATGEIVRSAYLQAQSSATLTQAAQALVEATELSAQAMREGFELGTVTNVDVLIALRDQFQAQRELQRTRYEHIRYLLLLKREAGMLSAEDLLEVGSWLVPSQR